VRYRLQKYLNGGQLWVVNVLKLYYTSSDTLLTIALPLALSIYFPLLLWRFPSSQLFCVHYTQKLTAFQDKAKTGFYSENEAQLRVINMPDTNSDLHDSRKSEVKLSRYRHAGDKGERNNSCYSFSTSVLDGGEWSESRPGCALARGKDLRYPLCRRLAGPQSRSGHRG
jgi:hypothetical protein